MKISVWLFCLGFIFCQQIRGAPGDIKLTGFSNTDGQDSVSLAIRKPDDSQLEFVTLKSGESHGNIKVIAVNAAEGEAKIQQGDSTITLSLGKGAAPKRTLKAPEPVRMPPAKLNGLALANGEFIAFFEIPNTSPRPFPQFISLKQGEREGALEFVGFDSGTGQVKIRENSQERSIAWEAGEATLDFKNAPLIQVLDIFRHWDKRGWAASSAVLGTRITLRLEGIHSPATALAAVKNAFREKEVLLLSAGNKLIMAEHQRSELLLASLVSNFPADSSKTTPAKSGEMVPLINFDAMPLGQVLDFYSDLVNRTVLHAASLPITTFISLRAGPLTKAEGVAATEAAMALNGIQTLPVAEKFVFVTTQGQLESVRPIAEKMTQTLEDPITANVSGDSKSKVPLINFDNMPMDQVCKFYAQLAGRELAKDEQLPNTFVSLKSQGPLSNTEALAALEAVLALNGAELAPVGGTGLKFFMNGVPATRRVPANNAEKKP